LSPEQFVTVITKLDLLQIDVAVICGVTPRTVNNWYHGRQPVPRAVALILTALYQDLVPIEWVAARVIGWVDARVQD